MTRRLVAVNKSTRRAVCIVSPAMEFERDSEHDYVWVDSDFDLNACLVDAQGAVSEDTATKQAGQLLLVRSVRTSKLAACDWTQGKDTPLTKAKQAEWAAYRQALRDVTDQPGFPASISWPQPPTK